VGTDDKLKMLSLPAALVDGVTTERGGGDTAALVSVQRALADARAVTPQNAAEAADAAKRRQLITEIRAMERAKANVAIEGMISGALLGVAGQVAWEAIQWWRASRSDRNALSAAHQTADEVRDRGRKVLDDARRKLDESQRQRRRVR
jgi:hypothetical protein